MLRILKTIKEQLRPAPSLREAHRRYLLHLDKDGKCDFTAAGLTEIEHTALEWVLKYSPSADRQVYDPFTALSTWWIQDERRSNDPTVVQPSRHEVALLLERWDKQEEAARYRLNMPPGLSLPYGSAVDTTWF